MESKNSPWSAAVFGLSENLLSRDRQGFYFSSPEVISLAEEGIANISK